MGNSGEGEAEHAFSKNAAPNARLTSGFPLVRKPGPRHEGQGETKKEAGHSTLGGGRFNQQGNLPTRFTLASARRVSGSPARILKVDIKAITAFGPICHPGGLKDILLSQRCALEYDSHSGNSRKSVHF